MELKTFEEYKIGGETYSLAEVRVRGKRALKAFAEQDEESREFAASIGDVGSRESWLDLVLQGPFYATHCRLKDDVVLVTSLYGEDQEDFPPTRVEVEIVAGLMDIECGDGSDPGCMVDAASGFPEAAAWGEVVYG